MNKTVLEPKRPAHLHAGKHHEFFPKVGLRHRVINSKRLLERFGLKRDHDHTEWHLLAWAVHSALTGCKSSDQIVTSQGNVLMTSHSLPVEFGQPENREIAVIIKKTASLSLALPEEVVTLNTAVLLVEDDPQLSAMTMMAIERLGVEAVHAVDGMEGLRLARELMPAAIVTDVDLTGMNGLELCERLKADSRTAGIPILIWSGDPEYRERAMEIDAFDFLTKPGEVTRLPDCLRRMLGR